nr:MAG TPA: YtpI-like protein [Caudoviricetes sp.]
MTTKTKKSLVWYGIFITALILNQTKSFADDITVKVVVHALWVILGAVTYVYFRESKWD